MIMKREIVINYRILLYREKSNFIIIENCPVQIDCIDR